MTALDPVTDGVTVAEVTVDVDDVVVVLSAGRDEDDTAMDVDVVKVDTVVELDRPRLLVVKTVDAVESTDRVVEARGLVPTAEVGTRRDATDDTTVWLVVVDLDDPDGVFRKTVVEGAAGDVAAEGKLL